MPSPNTAAHDVPVEMEDRLPRARADVDGDTVIRQALARCHVRHKLEHPLRLCGRELADLAERVDVPLGQHEEVHGRLRVDVADRDEAVGRRDVVALAVERAEEAVVVHAASTPSSETPAARTRTSAPTGAASGTSHGE